LKKEDFGLKFEEVGLDFGRKLNERKINFSKINKKLMPACLTIEDFCEIAR